mgnify:CR=1 FL=1
MIITDAKLNILCTDAIPAASAFSGRIPAAGVYFKAYHAAMNTTVPIILNYRCITAVRFALTEPPAADSIVVMHVPIFCPIITGIATS